MNTRIFRTLFILLFSAFATSGFAKEMKVESFSETVEDLTANTQPVMDINNNKCALIKISIPEKASFEGNIVKAEYKTNEYYVYVSPGTKRIAIKYPGLETLMVPLSNYLDGSGLVTGRTYRLKITGLPQEYVWKPVKFILKAYADVGFGNAISATTEIPDISHKATATNFGLDLGYNVWQNPKNSLSVNLGIGVTPLSYKLSAENLSFNYYAPAAADMDGNTYYRYYDLNAINQDIKTTLINIPIYLQYNYNIKHWLGAYVNFGASLAFKAGSNFKSVGGDGYAYGIYPEYGDLKIEESYLNGFGNMNLGTAVKQPVETNGFSGSMLFGAGLEGRISGPLWVFAGVKYNLGFSDIYKNIYKAGESFTEENAPLTYLVSEGEIVNSMTGYLTKSKLSMFSLNVGLILKF